MVSEFSYHEHHVIRTSVKKTKFIRSATIKHVELILNTLTLGAFPFCRPDRRGLDWTHSKTWGEVIRRTSRTRSKRVPIMWNGAGRNDVFFSQCPTGMATIHSSMSFRIPSTPCPYAGGDSRVVPLPLISVILQLTRMISNLADLSRRQGLRSVAV